MLAMPPFNAAARHDSQANQLMSPAAETIVPMTLIDAGAGRPDRTAGSACGALACEFCMFVSMVMGAWSAAIGRRCLRQSFFGTPTAHLEHALATREVAREVARKVARKVERAWPAGSVCCGYRQATVGTDKRERQRTNRAIREDQVAKAKTREKTTRTAIIVVGAIVAVFGIVLIANMFIGDDDAATTDTLETLPAADSTVVGDSSDSSDAGNEAGGEVFAATGEFVPDGCPSPDGSAEQQQAFDAQPPMCLDPTLAYSALVTTNKGEITIDLDQDKAPVTVNNFVFLARNQYFDATTCHRIIPGFVVQCGDPTATGGGDPGYKFADELPEAGEYQIGSIAMANSGPDTNGSQFFIITGDQGAALPPQYTLFGEVATGFDETVLQMEAAGTASGSPSEPVEIESVVISTS
jgi:cyclophilin family peptidyl-prolyl cis-trans isomerase